VKGDPPRHLRRRALTERRWLAEPPVELAVSRYIAVVPFLWLDITMTNRGLTSYSSAIQAGHQRRRAVWILDLELGPVYIHFVQRTAATGLMMAAKHLSVFS
jgi:hypothetical protein